MPHIKKLRSIQVPANRSGEKLLANPAVSADPIKNRDSNRATKKNKSSRPKRCRRGSLCSRTRTQDRESCHAPQIHGCEKEQAGGKKDTAARKTKSRASAQTAQTIAPTDEEIRLRAYLVSERRHRLALPGDASADWLEAKRQLLPELGRR
jgi:hypothetical protein